MPIVSRNIIIVVMDKYSYQDAYINYIKSHYLPARLTFILYLVQKNHSYYGHFPMNYLRSLGISNVMTTHYIVLDMDLHLSGNVQPLFDKLVNAYEEMTHLPQAIYESYTSAVILPIFFVNGILKKCNSVKSCAYLFVPMNT